MIRIPLRPYAVAAVALLSANSFVAAQQPAQYPPEFNEPIKLYTVLGDFTRPITTSSKEAQAFFDQGVKLVYAFTLQNAARSFREAQKRDSLCAMCYWGEAWSWGAYLNGNLSPANAPRAHAAIQRAVQLKAKATPVERALIDAMAVRYVPVHDPQTRAKLDTAYSEEMARVYKQFPKDLDVGALYAESLMLLNRNRGTYEIDQPHVQKFHAILDAVLDRDMHHPGACHYYIHATEATSRPEKAEMCALHLGATIPGASHINHMPSHTFNRIGRWGDAVRANIEAWHTDTRAATGDGIAISAAHNLHMLLYAAAYDGQGAISTQAARDYNKLTRDATHYPALTLVRFGRFDEVLELPRAPTAAAGLALWNFARGYAHLRRGSVDSATLYLTRLDSAASGGGGGRAGGAAGGRGGGGGGSTNTLVTIVTGILRAELQAKEGNLDAAIATLQNAVTVEDDMAYAEPEVLPFAARHFLGAVQFEAKRYADAEKTYREDLEDHPRNGWSLFGLMQSLDAQGKKAEAAKVRAQFDESWVRADALLRASRY